jgi:hypothetical protein
MFAGMSASAMGFWAGFLGPLLAGLFVKQVKLSRAETDFHHLLERMRDRFYPESLQVLAFYWLRTVSGSGYERRERKILQDLLQQIPNEKPEWGQIARNLQTWISQTDFGAAPTPNPAIRSLATARSNLKTGVLAPYISRLLNEWLPLEISLLLVDEDDNRGLEDGGIPPLAKARAMERLLARERLSAGTLEALLRPGLLSPRFVYPADAEILRDVVLFMLGRTQAPSPPVLPAVLLCVGSDTPLPPDYAEAVKGGFLTERLGREEVHVPIERVQASQLLKGNWVRIGSILVTMDGRWWRAHRLLEDREQHLIAYRPGGQLRIDDSRDHAQLRIPWPEARSTWSGPVALTDKIEMFGREWQIERWERDAEQTWLNLVFVGALPISKIAPANETGLRRSRPASVDMAWAALENALAAAAGKRSLDPIEQLRRAELVPTGRGIFALIEAVMNHRRRKRELIETRLRSISYLQAELISSCGRTPWRILPQPVRARLLAGRSDPELSRLLAEVFEGFPVEFSEETRSSPPHAA